MVDRQNGTEEDMVSSENGTEAQDQDSLENALPAPDTNESATNVDTRPSETDDDPTDITPLETEKDAKPGPNARSRQSSRLDHLLSNTWLFDAAAISFSVACLIAVAIVLLVYDGKGRHPMPYGVTLNAVVSILATASKTALLCAVAGSIGQLKWNWFEQPRNLYDLQAFDDVSRGPAGSAAFLLGRPKNAFVALGAVITVLALVFDPFVQQILRYPSRTVETSNGLASTRKAQSFRTDWSSTELAAAINAGVWSSSDQFVKAPQCSSGHCNWDLFDSFGWCSECSDAMADAKLTGHCDFANWSANSTCRLSFGSGNSVIVAHGMPGSFGTGLSLTSEVTWSLGWTVDNPLDDYYLHSSDYSNWFNLTYMGVQNPPASIGYASFDAQGPYNTHDDTAAAAPTLKLRRAEQCVLTPCVRTYNISTRAGASQISAVATNYGVTKFVNPRGGSPDLEDFVNVVACWQPDHREVRYVEFYEDKRLSGGSCNNAYQCDWWNATENAFCPIFSYGNKIETSLNATTRTEYSYEGAGEAGWSSNGAFNTSDIIRQIASHNLSYVLGNVAASLTNLALDLNSEAVTGRVQVNETYVVVRWPWLILPVALEAAGIFLFLAVVYRTRKRGIVFWQSSLLPLLFGGIDQGADIDPMTDSRLSNIEQRARSTVGQLLYSANSRRILVAEHADD